MYFYIRWSVPAYQTPAGTVATISYDDLNALLYQMDSQTGLPIKALVGYIFLTHGGRDQWFFNIPGANIEIYEH